MVLVGANTARNENYRQPKARGEFAFLNRKPPRLAVVSSSLEFDLTTPLFNAGQEPTIVFNVGTTTPSAELLKIAYVIQLPDEDPSSFAASLIEKLFELGLRKVTCEGGPSLLAQLLKADALNEYDLTISPLTVGGSPQWADALPKTTDWVEAASATSGDFEFKRLLRS